MDVDISPEVAKPAGPPRHHCSPFPVPPPNGGYSRRPARGGSRMATSCWEASLLTRAGTRSSALPQWNSTLLNSADGTKQACWGPGCSATLGPLSCLVCPEAPNQKCLRKTHWPGILLTLLPYRSPRHCGCTLGVLLCLLQFLSHVPTPPTLDAM